MIDTQHADFAMRQIEEEVRHLIQQAGKLKHEELLRRCRNIEELAKKARRDLKELQEQASAEQPDPTQSPGSPPLP